MGDFEKWRLGVRKFLQDRIEKEINEKKQLVEEVRRIVEKNFKKCEELKGKTIIQKKVEKINAKTNTEHEKISLNVFKVYNISEKCESLRPKLKINTAQKSLRKSITQRSRPKNFNF